MYYIYERYHIGNFTNVKEYLQGNFLEVDRKCFKNVYLARNGKNISAGDGVFFFGGSRGSTAATDVMNALS